MISSSQEIFVWLLEILVLVATSEIFWLHLYRIFFRCIFTGDFLDASSQEIFWMHLHLGDCRALPRATFHHRLPGKALPSNHTPYLVRTPCLRITYIRIHRVYVLRVHTYCLGGVLLEGLRIRLTSDYSVEAAGGWLHLIIHNGLLTFPTTRCQDKRKAGSDPLIERIKQHDTI